LANERNMGFCAGNNIGIRHALAHGARYVYLLNNDTTSEPDALAHLVAAAEANAKFGIVAPVMHREQGDREIWFAGSRLDLARGSAVHDNSRAPGRDEAPYVVPWITGCAMLVRAEVFEQIGGLDERYFLSWEDVDFSVRASKAGWELGVAPAARIYHKGGQASTRLLGNNRDYYDLRNRLLFLKTHGGFGYFRSAPGIMARMIYRALREPVAAQGERRKILGGIAAAIGDHLLGRYGEAPGCHAGAARSSPPLAPARAPQ